MTFGEACALLELPIGCTEADVAAARRRLAALHHPDREGGSHERMQTVNSASDIVEAALRARASALTPSAVVSALQALSSNQLMLRSDVERATRRVSETLTDRSRGLRRATLVGAAASAVCFLAANDIAMSFAGALGVSGSDSTLGVARLVLLLAGAYFGVLAWIASLRIESIGRWMEEFTQSISLAAGYLAQFQCFADADGEWTLADLEAGIVRWARTDKPSRREEATVKFRLAHSVGSAALARLLVVKGLELGLLRGRIERGGSAVTEKYSLVLPESV